MFQIKICGITTPSGAQCALAGGADWLAVVGVPEALALREAGIIVPVLCLMDDPQGAHAEAIGRGIDLCVGTRGTLVIAGWIPDDNYRAGSLLVLTDANVSLASQTFRIFDIKKAFLSDGRQVWEIAFGAPKPSIVKLIRRYTRTSLD